MKEEEKTELNKTETDNELQITETDTELKKTESEQQDRDTEQQDHESAPQDKDPEMKRQIKDPGAAWAAENAEATGKDNERNWRSVGIPGKVVIAAGACALVLLCLYFFRGANPGQKPAEETAPGAAATEQAAQTAEAAAASTMEAAEQAYTGRTAGKETAAVLSPETEALEKSLRKKIGEKDGKWSLYLYRYDTEEEIGINANDPMISASLVKLYIAGCYLEKVERGEVEDKYDNQLFAMLSASDNGATNTLIDVLGMEEINDFIKAHKFSAGQLNRKMLENNGTENYTSSKDCGRILRQVFEGKYINEEASDRVMEALRAQIERNRHKIPAGVPKGVETANKTGELYTKDENGKNVAVQNDAAVIFAEDHPYVLVIMTTVPSVGEGEMHRQIAEISEEVYLAVTGSEKETDAEESTDSEKAEDAEEETDAKESKDSEKAR